jgi:hypothetical protein
MIDQHRNPRFWNQITPKQWEFNGWSCQNFFSLPDSVHINPCLNTFESNNSLENNQPAKYITFGKGYA